MTSLGVIPYKYLDKLYLPRNQSDWPIWCWKPHDRIFICVDKTSEYDRMTDGHTNTQTEMQANKTTVMRDKPAEHMKAITKHNTTTHLYVCEADRTFKRLRVLYDTVILGGYQSVVVDAFTLPYVPQHRQQLSHHVVTINRRHSRSRNINLVTAVKSASITSSQ